MSEMQKYIDFHLLCLYPVAACHGQNGTVMCPVKAGQRDPGTGWGSAVLQEVPDTFFWCAIQKHWNICRFVCSRDIGL